MTALVLSKHLSFHARGEAAFVWHGLTGDVAEMSRDVVALLLAFKSPVDAREVARAQPGQIPAELARHYIDVLRGRRFLLVAPARGSADELTALLAGFPRVPRGAIFVRKPGATEGAACAITVYGREGQKLELDPLTSTLFDRCTGERSLGQVLADAGPSALDALLRLARADFAALKILAKRVSEGGVRLNPAADSTMPYPEIPDVQAFAAGAPAPGPAPSELARYHTEVIRDADQQFDETETTLAHLFREPHPALKGKTFGAALAEGLLFKGALKGALGRGARVLELGGGLGVMGRALQAALAQSDAGAAGVSSVHLDLSPVLARAQKKQGLTVARGDALALPIQDESVDLVVCNEMAGDLGTTLDPESLKPHAPDSPPAPATATAEPGDLRDEDDGLAPAADANPSQVAGEATAHVAKQAASAAQPQVEPQGPRFINTGALELIRQAARVLRPDGMLYLSEFGDPKANPLQSDHLDHDEWSIRFNDLRDEAKRLGLKTRVLPLTELLSLDGNEQALSTTRASFAALKALFEDHGLKLTKRAWLRTEIEALCAGKLELSQVSGLLWAPLSERTMGLSPRQFFVLLATKAARTLH